MHAMGLLPTDKIVCTSGGELIGQFVGQAQKNVAEAFDAAEGGVLFIDEADALASNCFECHSALSCLLARMSSPTHQVRLLISQQSILPFFAR